MDNFKTAREVLKKIFTQFNNNLGLYTTIFVTATYHLISERDFACSCKPQNQQKACWLHLFLPVLLLWFLLLLLDKGLHRAVGKICLGKDCEQVEGQLKSGVPDTGRACCLAMVSVLHTLSISSIWMAIVFLDGDWWLCCQNDGSDDQAQVACKTPDVRTVVEKSIAADLISWSKNIGLAVLLGAAIIMALTKVCAYCKCKRRDDELAERIFEEGLDVVLEVQREEALEQLKNHVKTQANKKEWKKCSEVVQELIIEMKKSKEMTPGSEGDDGGGGTSLGSSRPVSPSPGTSSQRDLNARLLRQHPVQWSATPMLRTSTEL